MFTDRITFKAFAGKGGNGVVAWRREKYLPKGGPYGGNGGRGGDVILQASHQLTTLDPYHDRKHLKAQKGADGGSNNRQGKGGEDLVIKVPCGTLVKDVETGEVIADLIKDGEKLTVCTGGKGGRGNSSFKSATHRAPNFATPGDAGEEKNLELELKLIAQIGLVGFPNAGKSTLINSLTRMSVKTAPYPFTTRQPHLGFITLEDYRRVFIADIPGIIEGASKNRGLGLAFLRHIERTKMLLYVLDASGIDGRSPWDDWVTLRRELEDYNSELIKRPHIILLNKIDDDAAKENLKAFHTQYSGDALAVIEISAILEQGLEQLIAAVKKQLL